MMDLLPTNAPPPKSFVLSNSHDYTIFIYLFIFASEEGTVKTWLMIQR